MLNKFICALWVLGALCNYTAFLCDFKHEYLLLGSMGALLAFYHYLIFEKYEKMNNNNNDNNLKGEE